MDFRNPSALNLVLDQHLVLGTKTWVVGLEPKPGALGIFRRERTKQAKATLRDELDAILAAAPEIESQEWLERHLADLPPLAATDRSKADETT